MIARLAWVTQVLLFLLLAGCGQQDEQSLFSLKDPKKIGIDFRNDLTETPELNIIEYLYFYNGAGVAVGDINNDRLPDIYLASNQGQNRLFLNQGEFSFLDVTNQAGLGEGGDWSTGVSMADVNGDGYLDIYQCQVSGYKGLAGKNQLFINNGDATFSEQAESYGVDFAGLSTHSAWLDYDLDGDLDLYLLNHSVHSTRSYGQSSLRYEVDTLAGDRLYKNLLNEGSARFKDVSAEAGILGSQIGYGLGVGVSDLNNDGFPDIYVSNDFHENDYLYLNNGDGTFTESLTEMTGHTSRFSMGNDIADINNDGLQDIISLDMYPDEEAILKSSESVDSWEVNDIRLNFGYGPQYPRNHLQLNRGNGQFSEIGLLSGVYASDWSWASLMVDLDNDGRKDIFVTNGIYRRPNDSDYINYTSNAEVQRSLRQGMTPENMRLIERMPSIPLRNYVFRNTGQLTFEKNPEHWGLDQKFFSNGAAYGDFDNDGDYDLVLNNLNEIAAVYENHTQTRSVRLLLQGPEMNPFGIGTKVTAWTGNTMQHYELYASRGFMSSSQPALLIGMANSAMIDSLNIVWPGGRMQHLTNIPADTTLIVDFSKAVPPAIPVQEPAAFFSAADKLSYRHVENPYNDYEREPLIPHKLTTEGPCLSVADVNGDGREDIFFGGAHYQAGQILLQQPDGTFSPGDQKVFLQDRFSEDVSSLFFDADGDGDPDLFVVSGGSELPLSDFNMQDRLYLNDGNGVFSRSKGLPEYAANGSCVKGADWDNDGDMDLFVGSRSVPGQYGIGPMHFFLENDGEGRFEVTMNLQDGMVTDALFFDPDQDGDQDLILSGEWMPLRILINQDGRFTEGDFPELAATSGWYFSLQEADINEDGYPDVIAGNIGENNILKPTPEKPVRLYLNDFDQNGTADPIITYMRNGKEYPIATRSQLTAQLVSLKKKFPGSRDFAGKTLQEIFTAEELNGSLVRVAYTFSHLVLINKQGAGFDIEELPLESQLAPIQDIAITDINQDGHNDYLFGYNFYGASPYFGRYDAGLGDVFINDGKGDLKFLPHRHHSLKLTGDLRGLEMINIGGIPNVISLYNNDSIRVQPVNREFTVDNQAF